MRPERLVLREVEMPLKTPFVSALGTETTRRFLIVEAHAAGLVGYGEVSVLSAPFYWEETAGTAWHVLESYLAPLAFSQAWHSPSELAVVLRPVRRHLFAKAGLEAAVWDLYTQAKGVPLSQALGAERHRVPAGVAVGLMRSIPQLIDTVTAFVQSGYRRVKVKIEPGWDWEPLSALRRRFPDLPLMADANSAYSLDDIEALRRLDALNLLMIEQPLGPDDIVDHAQLQKAIRTPICLDESLCSLSDVRKALALGSCQVVSIKPGRVGGLTEAVRIHDYCLARGVPVWCGGMLESGIGRAQNVALAALPGFSFPGDLSASDRYYHEDIIDPPISVDAQGCITVPSGAGLGVAVHRHRLERWSVRHLELRPA